MLFLKLVLIIVPLVNVNAADSYIGNSRNWNDNHVSQPTYALPKPLPKPIVVRPIEIVEEKIPATEATVPIVSENNGLEQTRFNFLPQTRPLNAWEPTSVTTAPVSNQESWTPSTLSEQTAQPEQRETTENALNNLRTLSQRNFLMSRHYPQPNRIQTISALPAPVIGNRGSTLVRPLQVPLPIENSQRLPVPPPEISTSVPSIAPGPYEEPKQNNILITHNQPSGKSTILGEPVEPLVSEIVPTPKSSPPSRLWMNTRPSIRPVTGVQKITEATSPQPEPTTTTPTQTTVVIEVVKEKEPVLKPSEALVVPSLPEEIIQEQDPELIYVQEQENSKDKDFDGYEEPVLSVNQEPESIEEQDPGVINVEIVREPSVAILRPENEWNRQEGMPIRNPELSVEPQHVNEPQSVISPAITDQRYYRPRPKLTTPPPVKPIVNKRPVTRPTPKPLPSKNRPAFVPKSPLLPEYLPQPVDVNPAQPVDYECRDRNGYYGVQNDCDSYVECRKNLAFMFTCPDGLRFNRNAAWPEYPCSYVWEVQCEANAIQRDPQPTSECPRQYGFFPVGDSDCSRYIMCQGGRASLMNCPPGLVFNANVNACDWPENVPSCRPNAFLGFTCPAVSEDDEDLITKYRRGDSCRDYVACRRGQPRLLSCDPGLAFDEEAQVCVDADYVPNCQIY